MPVVLLLMAWLNDLSGLLIARIQLANAVGNAATYAMLAGASVSTSTLTAIVQKTAFTAGTTPAASITGPACYCVTGAPASTLTAATCGASCTNGTTAASFVQITGTYTYVPLLGKISSVANTTLTETASVKLQ